MQPTAGIERSLTRRTCIAGVQIFLNRQLMAAASAQDGPFKPLILPPSGGRVMGERFMTLITRKVSTTTRKLDGDDIDSGMIVPASSLRIHFNARYLDAEYIPYYMGHNITSSDPETISVK